MNKELGIKDGSQKEKLNYYTYCFFKNLPLFFIHNS
jgi:hypothetical protein